MKKMLVIVALSIGVMNALAATGSFEDPARIRQDTVFEWEPVVADLDGQPVTIDHYVLGAFPTNAPDPICVTFPVSTNGVFGSLVTNLMPNVVYEARVMAASVDGLTSPWSTPVYIFRHRQLPPPHNPRIAGN